ncbi:MAG: hypothetical protein HPY45_11065 [Anaerolineae bacterium]|nr:hypothetical protein [Anaerolineae bacterium]
MSSDVMSATPFSVVLSRKTVWIVAILLTSLLVLVPCMPSMTLPGHDSGIFLYFGAQILEGRLPFRDLWDHKPPLVFYLNALGLWLGRGSVWGVWAVELVSLVVAGILAYFFLRRYVRDWIAGVAVLGGLVNLALVLERGNLTEEYALPFQFAALLLFVLAEHKERYGWRGIGIGMVLACAFLLKQTLIGVWLAIFFFLLYQAFWDGRWRAFWNKLMTIAIGAGIVLSVCVVYFALNRSLALFWDVAFHYNFIYSDVSIAQRVQQWLDELWIASATSGFFMIGFVAWFAALVYLLIHHPPLLKIISSRWMGVLFVLAALPLLYRGFVHGLRFPYALTELSPYRLKIALIGLVLVAAGVWYILSRVSERRFLVWFERTLQQEKLSQYAAISLLLFLAVFDFPLELLLISISSENYHHYFISLIPCFTMLTAFFFESLCSFAEPQKRHYMPVVWAVLFIIPLFEGGAYALASQMKPGRNLQVEETVAYIEQHTAPQDNVLVWGSQTVVNFLSGRSAPTPYVHQKPLFKKGYTTPAHVAAFLADLETRSPALIIDTRLPSTPFVEVDAQGRCGWQPLDYPLGMEEVFDFICRRYELVKTIGSDQWRVYRYRKGS